MKKTVLITIIALISISGYSQSVEDRTRMLFFAAEEAYNIENYTECIEKLNDIEKLLGATNSRVLELKINSYYNLGRYIEAYDSKAKFFEITASAYSGYNNILRITLDIENMAFEQFSKNGFALFDERRFEEAIKQLKNANNIKPSDYNTLNKLAYSYYFVKSYEEANICFKELVRLRPFEYELNFLFARTYWELKNRELADFYFQRALEIFNINEDEKDKNDKTIWEKAENIGTIYAYNDFLEKNPENNYRVEAYLKIAETIVYGMFVDPRDNKIYKSVRIGDRIWMAQNLAYNSGRGVYMHDNDEDLISLVGYLYPFNRIKDACPPGWRVPAERNFKALTMQIVNDEGLVIKDGKAEGSTEFINNAMNWASPGIDKYALAIQPAGEFRNKELVNLGHSTYLWSTTIKTSDKSVFVWGVWHADDYISEFFISEKGRRFSLRCIKSNRFPVEKNHLIDYNKKLAIEYNKLFEHAQKNKEENEILYILAEKAFDLDPENYNALGYYTWSKFNKKDYNKAYDKATKGLHKYPENTFLNFIAGISQHFITGNSEDNRNYFKKIIEILKEEQNTRLVYAYYYLGDKEKAFKIINDLKNQGEDLNYLLSCLYSLENNISFSVDYLRRHFENTSQEIDYMLILNSEDFNNVKHSDMFSQLIREYNFDINIELELQKLESAILINE